MLRLDPYEKLNLDEQDTIIVNSTSTTPRTIIEIPTKNYVDKKCDDPSIIKDTTHVDFNDKNLDNVRFLKGNSFPAIPGHLTLKIIHVDNGISYSLDESSLLRIDPNENLKLDEQDSIIPNFTLTSPRTVKELPTKSYVDRLHESSGNKRDLSSVFNDQDKEFDNNKLTILDRVTIFRNPISDNEVSNGKYVDDAIGEGTIVRFNQTLENYLKVSVGNGKNRLTKYDKKQCTDTTEIKLLKIGSDILQKWNIKCNNKIIQCRITDFIKSTKTSSPAGHLRATSLPTIGKSFMYVETSSNNYGNNVFVSFDRTDIILISNITFCYKGFQF